MFSDLLIKMRRFNPHGIVPHERSEYGPFAVDILCRNTSGGNLTGSRTDGCDWVMFDWANQAAGKAPPVVKAPAGSTGVAMGCVHWDEGVKGDDTHLWVRIFGQHDYALIYGDASLAIGWPIVIDASVDGRGAYAASPAGRRVGFMREAYTTAAAAAKKVLITNPMGFPT